MYGNLWYVLVVGCCNEVTVIKCRLVIETVFDYMLRGFMFGTHPHPNCGVTVRPYVMSIMWNARLCARFCS